MITCWLFGHKLDDGGNYCSECGYFHDELKPLNLASLFTFIHLYHGTLLCWVLGHIQDGERHCKRCKMPDNEWKPSLQFFPRKLMLAYYRLRRRVWNIKFRIMRPFRVQYCYECGKPYLRGGRLVGDHKNCIPF